MDYSRRAEMHHHHHPPNPNPVITDPYAQFHNPQPSSTYPLHYSSYYPPPPVQNPNPSFTDPQTSLEHYGGAGVLPVPLDASLQPPGVDPYTYHPPLAGYDAQTTAAALYRQQVQNWAAGTFYADASTKPAKEAEPSIPANLNPAQWTNPVVQPYMNGLAIKKGSKKIKKIKIVQSFCCEVCKIDCTSRDILAQHKIGKKHKKNLEKLEEAKRIANQPAARVNVAPPPYLPPPVVTNPLIGPSENPTRKKKAAPSSTFKEDLETKRRKLMEGGASAEAVRICTLCNVACNSDTVFNYHLAGQKHASMVKRLA